MTMNPRLARLRPYPFERLRVLLAGVEPPELKSIPMSIGEPKHAPPDFIARALSYMSVNDFKAAASDLDDAVSTDPQNLQAWTSRGLAYERLGDKEKAAGSYAKALNIKLDHEPAKAGFARLGGQMGRTYQTF